MRVLCLGLLGADLQLVCTIPAEPNREFFAPPSQERQASLPIVQLRCLNAWKPFESAWDRCRPSSFASIRVLSCTPSFSTQGHELLDDLQLSTTAHESAPAAARHIFGLHGLLSIIDSNWLFAREHF